MQLPCYLNGFLSLAMIQYNLKPLLPFPPLPPLSLLFNVKRVFPLFSLKLAVSLAEQQQQSLNLKLPLVVACWRWRECSLQAAWAPTTFSMTFEKGYSNTRPIERERATNLSRLGLLICQGCTETVAYTAVRATGQTMLPPTTTTY